MPEPMQCAECGQVHARCAAHRRSGEPCGTLPRKGQRVCRMHEPDAAQEATGDDLSAPEGESGAEERGDPDPLHLTILRDTVDAWRDMSIPSVSTRGWQRGWRAGVDLCTEILAEIADEYEKGQQ